MRYLFLLLATAALAGPLTVALALVLAPAPIAAEYWVREMIVVKRHISDQHQDRRKIVVAAGSATLFGIDAKQLGEDLGVPAINLGLHAALPLRSILEEAGRAAAGGDAVILALEDPYYCVAEPTAWQARNLMAWQPERWLQASLADRFRSLFSVGPAIVPDLAQARVAAVLFPGWIEDRRAAMDDARVLARFASAPVPTSFAYSAFHLDRFGNMQATEGARYRGGAGPSPEAPPTLCADSADELGAFSREMRRKKVTVYFANTPAVDTGKLDRVRVSEASRHLAKALAPYGVLLDSKADVVLPRALFFDSHLHLNASGRAVRTRTLAAAIRAEGDLLKHLRDSAS